MFWSRVHFSARLQIIATLHYSFRMMEVALDEQTLIEEMIVLSGCPGNLIGLSAMCKGWIFIHGISLFLKLSQ